MHPEIDSGGSLYIYTRTIRRKDSSDSASGPGGKPCIVPDDVITMSHRNVQPPVSIKWQATDSRGHWWGAPTPLLRGSVHPISVFELAKNEVDGGVCYVPSSSTPIWYVASPPPSASLGWSKRKGRQVLCMWGGGSDGSDEKGEQEKKQKLRLFGTHLQKGDPRTNYMYSYNAFILGGVETHITIQCLHTPTDVLT